MYSGLIRSRPTAYSTVTIQHNPFQAHSLQHSYHPTQSFPGSQPTAQLPSNTILSRPTAYSTVTIQHNHLNRKNIIQNQKYKCKNDIQLIYSTCIHCTCKFERHKQSFLSENCEQTFPNKKHKRSNAHESINNLSLVKTIIEFSIIKE